MGELPIHSRMFPFFVGCKKFIIGYKVILLTVQANCVAKKTPETLEVFPKETFTSLMVVSPKFQES